MTYRLSANALKRVLLFTVLIAGMGTLSACELLFTPEAGHGMRSGSGAAAREAADHAAANCPNDAKAQQLAADARKAAEELDQAQAKERQTRAAMHAAHADFSRAVQLKQDFDMSYPGSRKNMKAYQERIAAHDANVKGFEEKLATARAAHDQAEQAATKAADRASRLATQIYAQCPRSHGKTAGTHSRGQETFSHTKGQHQEPGH